MTIEKIRRLPTTTADARIIICSLIQRKEESSLGFFFCSK